MGAVKDIGEIAARSPAVDELLMSFLDKAISMTKAQKGTLFVVEADNEWLRLVGSRGIDQPEKGTRVKISETLLKHAISEQKPLLGKILIKSEVDRGTRVIIGLPASNLHGNGIHTPSSLAER